MALDLTFYNLTLDYKPLMQHFHPTMGEIDRDDHPNLFQILGWVRIGRPDISQILGRVGIGRPIVGS